MGTGRLEAFSDGVIAIIITIMVLELRPPPGTSFAALLPLLPVLLSYVLSFVYVGIYWNNHHHLLAACEHVSGSVLWANLHLLFWLSLFPFVTAWMGQNPAATVPAAVYGGVLLMAALAYGLLQHQLLRVQGGNELLRRAIGRDWKGRASPLLYSLGIVLTLGAAWMAQLVYVVVAALWLVPDRRIETVATSRDR